MSGTWRLRGYHVTSLLGRGASSEVWRGHVSATGEPVALKRLFLGPDRSARAHAEAAFLTVLDHPNLVRLHALVPADDSAVLVLDLADGGSLADLLRARGRLSSGEVIGALAPVAAALAYLHEHEIAHGDVSAANVLFTTGGVPLLADLGVARLTGDDSDAESTPSYVDPAVAAGCIPGRGSDVFMLGGVALHALTGSPTWPGHEAGQALAAARAGRLADVPARLARAGVPDALVAVVARALHPDPMYRGTAGDFALDLRAAGRPVAVELAAGLPAPLVTTRARPAAATHVGVHRWLGPEPPTHDQTTPRIARHAALPLDDIDAVDQPGATDGVRSRTSGSVPDRPVDVSDGARGAPPPTSAIRRPRPLIPRTPVRRWDRWGRRVTLPISGMVVAALVALAAALWWPSSAATAPSAHDAPAAATASATRPSSERPSADRTSRSRASTPRPGTLARRGPDRSSKTTGSRPTATAPRSTVRSGHPPLGSSSPPAIDERWVATLHALDSLRARAFATRDVALLSRVYVTGPLLTADRAMLRRTVPPGCGLAGARTTFTDVRVRAGAATAWVSARATLSASTLSCPGRADRAAAGVGTSRLTIRLVHRGASTLIAAQRVQ